MTQLIDRLVSDIIEVTESLKQMDSPAHALSALGNRSTAMKTNTKLNKDEGSGDSGTYAKQC